MDKDNAERIDVLEKRVDVLEKAVTQIGNRERIVEIRLMLPEADIEGLHFNKMEVHAVFEKQDDGWYHSRDILFLSARNVKDDNSRDILMEYLNLSGDNGLREQLAYNFGVRQHNIEISLPPKNEGVKKYNGVDWWYWLASPQSGSAAAFWNANGGGHAGNYHATGVGGCAPTFRVA